MEKINIKIIYDNSDDSEERLLKIFELLLFENKDNKNENISN